MIKLILYEVFENGNLEPVMTIKAVVKEKEQAKREFKEAVRQNREAVYAERGMRLTQYL